MQCSCPPPRPIDLHRISLAAAITTCYRKSFVLYLLSTTQSTRCPAIRAIAKLISFLFSVWRRRIYTSLLSMRRSTDGK